MRRIGGLLTDVAREAGCTHEMALSLAPPWSRSFAITLQRSRQAAGERSAQLCTGGYSNSRWPIKPDEVVVPMAGPDRWADNEPVTVLDHYGNRQPSPLEDHSYDDLGAYGDASASALSTL